MASHVRQNAMIATARLIWEGAELDLSESKRGRAA